MQDLETKTLEEMTADELDQEIQWMVDLALNEWKLKEEEGASKDEETRILKELYPSLFPYWQARHRKKPYEPEFIGALDVKRAKTLLSPDEFKRYNNLMKEASLTARLANVKEEEGLDISQEKERLRQIIIARQDILPWINWETIFTEAGV